MKWHAWEKEAEVASSVSVSDTSEDDGESVFGKVVFLTCFFCWSSTSLLCFILAVELAFELELELELELEEEDEEDDLLFFLTLISTLGDGGLISILAFPFLLFELDEDEELEEEEDELFLPLIFRSTSAFAPMPFTSGL